MSPAKLALLSAIWLAGATLPAEANILIQIDQSTQRMSVDADGQHLYDWRVSTGRPGYDTPNGTFRPNRMDADHFSQEYDNAPMPNAIFFDLQGHAIHGSYDPVGHPAASHGCVRLDPANAAKLFDLVKAEGMANTTVEITGDVRVALRNAKPAPQVRTARRQPLPSEPDANWDDDAQQLGSYDAYGYPRQPQLDEPSYGYYPAPQPGWKW
ncbi:MAG TPA: L,D-transpeptidase [Roseiarcus sp.]|nr:L,D-transpeptidase [Roseiarcus sp.]